MPKKKHQYYIDMTMVTKLYFPITAEQQAARTTKYNEVEVTLEYTLGGHNYFSGTRNARGYRVAFSPVNRGNGTVSRTLLGGNWESGGYIMLEETKRKNDKIAQKWLEAIDFQKVATLFANGETNAIVEYIKTFTKETVNA